MSLRGPWVHGAVLLAIVSGGCSRTDDITNSGASPQPGKSAVATDSSATKTRVEATSPDFANAISSVQFDAMASTSDLIGSSGSHPRELDPMIGKAKPPEIFDVSQFPIPRELASNHGIEFMDPTTQDAGQSTQDTALSTVESGVSTAVPLPTTAITGLMFLGISGALYRIRRIRAV